MMVAYLLGVIEDFFIGGRFGEAAMVSIRQKTVGLCFDDSPPSLEGPPKKIVRGVFSRGRCGRPALCEEIEMSAFDVVRAEEKM